MTNADFMGSSGSFAQGLMNGLSLDFDGDFDPTQYNSNTNSQDRKNDILHLRNNTKEANKVPEGKRHYRKEENQIGHTDPTGMAPEDIIISGTEKEKTAYLAMLHASTGNNYSLDASGKLQNDGVDANFKGTESAKLTSVIDQGINSLSTYNLSLTGGKEDDKGVFIDSYTEAKIDISDLKKLGKASTELQGAAIGHFLNEIQENASYSTATPKIRESMFNTAHVTSLGVEGIIYGELIGDNTVITRTDRPLGGSQNGYQTILYEYNSKNKFHLQQGANSVSKKTTINIGGIQIPSTEITTTLTGQLKLVKKIK